LLPLWESWLYAILEASTCWWFILRIACLGLVLTTAALYKCWALNLSSMLW
jgi:hypothetical protein